jgi:Fe-S cluster assembly protein SufD
MSAKAAVPGSGREWFAAEHERLEREDGGRAPAWVRDFRREGIARFAERGFPSPQDREWKGTDLSPLSAMRFEPSSRGGGMVAHAEVAAAALDAPDAPALVLVDGRLDRSLSAGPVASNGIVATSLREAWERKPDLVRAGLGATSSLPGLPLAALNAALFEDGACVFVPPGVLLEKPIGIVHVSTGGASPRASFPRLLIVAGEGSRVRVVEAYAGRDGSVYWTNAVTEIEAGPGAVVDHYRVVREGDSAYHTGSTALRVGGGASLCSLSIALGGAVVRGDLHALLDGEGADACVNGLFVVGGRQHVDHHTFIDHAKPHGTSRELFKGILDGHATGIFNGRIVVRPGAQKTNSRQTNRNLLLSTDALMNTNPELEIYADDVKCTHGATVGQMDEEALFYLRSRGIDEPMARGILTYAFAGEVLSTVRIPALRAGLDRILGTLLRGRVAEEERSS